MYLNITNLNLALRGFTICTECNTLIRIWKNYLKNYSIKWKQPQERATEGSKRTLSNFRCRQTDLRVTQPPLIHHSLICHCQGQGQAATYHLLRLEKVVGCNQPSLQDLHFSRTLRRAGEIVDDPRHKLFKTLLCP